MSVAKPMMCADDNETTASSRRNIDGKSTAVASEPTSARCVSSAPLGVPVVPDV